MTSSDKIAQALHDALRSSNDAERKALYDAIAEFQRIYERSYNDVRRQPFAMKMLDTMIEASEF